MRPPEAPRRTRSETTTSALRRGGGLRRPLNLVRLALSRQTDQASCWPFVAQAAEEAAAIRKANTEQRASGAGTAPATRLRLRGAAVAWLRSKIATVSYVAA